MIAFAKVAFAGVVRQAYSRTCFGVSRTCVLNAFPVKMNATAGEPAEVAAYRGGSSGCWPSPSPSPYDPRNCDVKS